MPLRFDRAELPEPERTAEGYLRTVAIVARPGVLVYPKPDGSEDRELVTADVLAASAQGLADRAMTLRHPTANGKPNGVPLRVSKDNVAKFSIGHSRDGIKVNEDGSIGVPVTITHADGIAAIDGGMRGISPLYDAVVVDAPPDSVHPTFGRYNKIQTSRTYNSIAIVPLGRGGPQCHLRADDSEANIEIEGGVEPEVAPAPVVAPPHADEIPPAPEPSASEAAPALAAILKLLGVATVDEAHAKLSTEWMELCAKRDAFHGILGLLSVENAEAAHAKIAAIVVVPEVRADSVEARTWFHGRAKLHAAAVALGMAIPDIAALGDDDLRKHVVLARQPTLRADESPAYYAAAFDMAPPVDHLAPLRLTGKPPELRADAAPPKKSTNPWDEAHRPVPARS